MADGDSLERASLAWLVAGWVCAVVWLASLPIIALFGIFGLLFCDAPGAPCGTYAMVELLFGAAYAALFFLIVRGLVRRQFGLFLRLAAFAGVMILGGGAAWLRQQLMSQM